MSNQYPNTLMKMNTYFHNVLSLFDYVIHPAAGKLVAEKQKKRSTILPVTPKATPDSLNIRDSYKKQGSFRRNPAP